MTLDPQPLAPAVAAAEEAGWAVLRLDLDGARSKAELMRRCGAALEAPDYFGGNWDALADALRDLSWLPDGVGRLLTITSWRGYAAERPEDWETLGDILEEAVDFWREGGEGGEVGLVVVVAESPRGRVRRKPAGGR